MSENAERAAKIAELNDQCRRGRNGLITLSEAVSTLKPADQAAIYRLVRDFNTFTPDNDPYGERDYGSFEYQGELMCWKIEYYAPDLHYGSEDPSDPAQTQRVLFIMYMVER